MSTTTCFPGEIIKKYQYFVEKKKKKKKILSGAMDCSHPWQKGVYGNKIMPFMSKPL